MCADMSFGVMGQVKPVDDFFSGGCEISQQKGENFFGGRNWTVQCGRNV